MKKLVLSAVAIAAIIAGTTVANNNDKVTICHKGQEITVSANAVEAHLAHGDKLGSCDDTNNPSFLVDEDQ